MSSIHPKFDVFIAVSGGFLASFLAFAAATVQRSDDLRGQLLAGDPSVNSELPTTLNTIQSVTGGTDPLMMAMSSYAWWILVLLGGLGATVLILKLMRRYA